MEQVIHDAFTPELLTQACNFFAIQDEPKFIRYFENFVYDVRRDDVDCILRITHSSHRITEQVSAEIHWLNYMVENGVSASPALRAPTGSYVFRMNAAKGYFTASLFLKAEGVHGKQAELSGDHYFILGRLIGKTQRLSKQYKVPWHLPSRNHWFEESYNDARKFLPTSDEPIVLLIETHIAKVKAWKTSPDNYGIIHSDAHPGNFFVDGSQITLFDFDDVHYNFFVCDAVTIFFSILSWQTESGNRHQLAATLQRQFWLGFNEQSSIDDIWLERIPDLILLRIMGIYVVLHAKLYPNRLTNDDKDNLAALRSQILAGHTHIDQFVKTAAQL
jgi:Ser/Thr protein kinase RdoA (MazF antagonist)